MSEASNRPTFSHIAIVCIAAFVLAVVFGLISLVWLYPAWFGFKPQPIVCAVTLYGVASAIWRFALRTAVSIDVHEPSMRRRLLVIVFSFSICFRLIQICAPPILELDLYRYMWDGIVLNSGVSPYRHAPSEVLTREVVIHDPSLKKLTNTASQWPSHRAILSEVHFPEYTTIYPPVSQLVFAASMWCVPDAASVTTHVTAMRLSLILFDLVTLCVVWGLLVRAKQHIGWLIAYAWNPLVIKEIANSGHLDSIAVCFMTAAVFWLVNHNADESDERRSWLMSPIGCSALLLACATAAKLFPVILLPIMWCYAGRADWRQGLRYGLVYGLATAFLMSWMLLGNDFLQRKFRLSRSSDVAQPQHISGLETRDGLTGFLGTWRMNDLVFSVVYENAKPDTKMAVNRAWYVWTPNSFRKRLHDSVQAFGLSGSPPFLIARAVTVGLFLIGCTVLVGRLQRRLVHAETPIRDLCATAFLTIAFFFITQPTQNPWYWVWAMPFVCFVRNRGWLLVAICLFAYYLRFVFKFSDYEFSFAGFDYRQAGIFDHCVAWVEHLAIFVSVGAGAYRNWRKNDVR